MVLFVIFVADVVDLANNDVLGLAIVGGCCIVVVVVVDVVVVADLLLLLLLLLLRPDMEHGIGGIGGGLRLFM